MSIKLKETLKKILSRPKFVTYGFCPACNSESKFIAYDSWLRDHYKCVNCSSIPRERALMRTIEMFFPDWRNLVIHESSPSKRGASNLLKKECKNYIPSQYFPKVESGETVNGVRCENLEMMSFTDNSVDLHVTQDVVEHILRPYEAFREIARTLKPGGAHIFTVGLVNKNNPSEMRAIMKGDGSLEYFKKPEYHGNPVDDNGSLVTVDWGYDIGRHIFEACGMFTQLIYIDDISQGIRAEYIETLVAFKDKPALLNKYVDV